MKNILKERYAMWYNYVTGEYESRQTPETDEEARELIPQLPAAQSLYGFEHKELSILEAMTKVLEAATTEPETENS